LASSYFRSIGRPRTGILLLGLPRQICMFIGLGAYAVLHGGLNLEAAAYWRTGTALLAAMAGGAIVVVHLRRQRQQQQQQRQQEKQQQQQKQQQQLQRDLQKEEDPPAWQAPSFPEYRQMATTVLGHLLASYLFSHQDLWFLGIFLTKEDVGLYGVMLQLTTLIAAMMSVVNLILPPMVSKMYDQGRHADVEALMRRIATLSGWFALLVLGILAIWGAAIIRICFGEQYVAGHGILVILAVGHVFNVTAGSPGYLLQMTGHHRALLRITIVSLVTNAVLNYVGVHVLGPIGVALATAVTFVLQNSLQLGFARRRTGIRTYAYLNPIVSIRGALR
jgi:O-antigen/teichoic acid export membrane protein